MRIFTSQLYQGCTSVLTGDIRCRFSCYVTLEEIAQIVREGNEIQVIDNKSKNDITYMTQIQLLFDQEKKSLKAFRPLLTFRELKHVVFEHFLLNL